MNMNKGGVVPRRAPLNLRCSLSGEDPRPRLLTVVVREASSQRARPLLGHPLRTRDGIQKYSFSLNEKKKIVFFPSPRKRFRKKEMYHTLSDRGMGN